MNVKLDRNVESEETYNWNSENGNFFLRYFFETEIDEIDSRELYASGGLSFVKLYRSIFDDRDFVVNTVDSLVR